MYVLQVTKLRLHLKYKEYSSQEGDTDDRWKVGD